MIRSRLLLLLLLLLLSLLLQAAIRDKFVAHKKLEKAADQFSSEIQALEVCRATSNSRSMIPTAHLSFFCALEQPNAFSAFSTKIW